MERYRRALFVGALVLVVATGYLAAQSAPGQGYATGIWPVGLASGLLLLAPPRREPAVLAAVFLVATLTILSGDRPAGVAVGYALSVTAEIWVMARILRGNERGLSLRNDHDLRRWFVASGCAVAVGTGGSALTSAVTGFGHPADVALAIGAAHAASQLCVTPFFLPLPEQGAIASGGERVAQWIAILVVTPLIFFPDAAPPLTFLAIPLLAWGALRITPFESLSQMVALVGLAIALTTLGRGPFADIPQRYGLSPDLRGVLLSAFAATCAVIVVPLMLRVGEYIGVARAASSERDLVQSIVDSAVGIAIIGTDQIGRISLFNPGAERLLGYSAGEVVGEFTTVLHTDEAITAKAVELGVRDEFATVALAMLGLEGTLIRFRRKDGTERTHAMTLTQLTDARGRATGYVSTSEDVTDGLAAQFALHDALEKERRAVERLRDVDAVKDAFVSTVSHELRTPITSIFGYLELLDDESLGPLTATQHDALSRMSANSRRLLSLIDDLLTLSRVAEHGVQPERREFDLRDAVNTAYAVVRPSWAPPRWLRVERVVPSDPVLVSGDREMIERVVVNLLGNAVKFTHDGGRIEIALDVDGAQAVLRVTDTGIGVPQDEQEQLFTRFFRSSLAQVQAIPGSGLGLSITRSIVERHDGSIELTSEVGVGTTVEVRLPLAPSSLALDQVGELGADAAP